MSTRTDRIVAMTVMAGGALVITGAFLPWLSLFAGLHPLRGVIGLNGRLIATGGLICLVSGVVDWRRRSSPARNLSLGLGLALTGFACWLIVQQAIVYRGLNPMLVPRRGIGLFVALAGSLLVAVSGFLPALGARRSSAQRIHVSPVLPSKGLPS